MKTLPEDIAVKLYDLIEAKKFAELSETEKMWVLHWLSKEEYEAFCKVPESFKKSLKQEQIKLSPSRSIQKSLLQEARSAKEKRANKPSWWQWPVPVYQLALGLVVLLVANWIWMRPISTPPQNTQVAERDTLYQVVEKVREVIKKDTVIKFVFAEGQTHSAPALLESKVPEQNNPSREFLSLGYASSPYFDSSHATSSALSEDSGLMRFSTKMF